MAKSRKTKKSKQYNRPAPVAPVVNDSTERTPEKAQSNGNIILVAGIGAAIMLFWYYHLLTLNQMTDLSNGLMMPDQMIGGYGVEHIEALRAGMDENAVGQLNYLHKTAGLLFPLFLSLITMLAVNLNTARGAIRWALWSVPMIFAVTDLWENRAIDALFTGVLDPAAVQLASTLTTVRWIFLFATLAILIGVLIATFVKTFRQKWDDSKQGLL
ncbi:hypothetical protein [Arthrobacter sp. MYb227]|uniref:hypothetical protein n=1 Tax=Arthrobacter sp. MYb227 TaxID=1848601 RepID=UPI002157D78D|nr:hypothetical protein [Arthrobacter sp. MYb227]